MSLFERILEEQSGTVGNLVSDRCDQGTRAQISRSDLSYRSGTLRLADVDHIDVTARAESLNNVQGCPVMLQLGVRWIIWGAFRNQEHVT